MNDTSGRPDDQRNSEAGEDTSDLRRFRISHASGSGAQFSNIVVSCPVRKPDKQEFVKTHPDPEMSMVAALIEIKAEQKPYLVNPELVPHLLAECVTKVLHTTISTNGALMLWPIRMPDEFGRLDTWNSAAHTAAERARTHWIRLTANRMANTYDTLEAKGAFPEPEWPDATLGALLDLGFRDAVIEDLDHAVLRRLRGEE